MISKRIFDVIASALALLLLAPLMLAVSVMVALTMGMPVIFKQRRPGYQGKDINVLKFRTMNDCRDENGKHLPDCIRETKFGKFLRNTSIDELPQLINVFLGQMSLVGPRPLMHMFVDNCTPEQMRRFDVKPGITGLAQIQGRKALDYDKRFEFDVCYVDNISIKLDLRIILATIRILINKEGMTETGKMLNGCIASHMTIDQATDMISMGFDTNNMETSPQPEASRVA